MNIYADTIRIEINGKLSTLEELENLPAPYKVRLVFKSDVLYIEVRK